MFKHILTIGLSLHVLFVIDYGFLNYFKPANPKYESILNTIISDIQKKKKLLFAIHVASFTKNKISGDV